MGSKKLSLTDQRINDFRAMNEISVPIAELRLYLAGLTVAGVTEIPLGSFWLEVRHICKEVSGGLNEVI